MQVLRNNTCTPLRLNRLTGEVFNILGIRMNGRHIQVNKGDRLQSFLVPATRELRRGLVGINLGE